jgi:hypothetical protein
MSAEKPSHDPNEHLPALADQKAFLAAADQEIFGYGDLPEQADHDRREAREMEAGLQPDAEAMKAQEAMEAEARAKLADIQDTMVAEVAAHDQEMAKDHEHPENVLAGNVSSRLEDAVANRKPGRYSLIDAGADDDLHRKVVGKVFGDLGFPDPMAELEADNRSRLRKFFRPKSRKTTYVSQYFASDDQTGVVTAMRSYSKGKKQYELQIFGGKVAETLNQPADTNPL